MAWKDLGEGILEEFAALSATAPDRRKDFKGMLVFRSRAQSDEERAAKRARRAARAEARLRAMVFAFRAGASPAEIAAMAEDVRRKRGTGMSEQHARVLLRSCGLKLPRREHPYKGRRYPPGHVKVRNHERDAKIRAMHGRGFSMAAIARSLGLSPSRVQQILRPA